jgi:hypothetical protein
LILMHHYPSPPFLARLSRAAWIIAAILAVVGAILTWDSVRERAFIGRIALTLEQGRPMSETERLETYVQYAHDQIRKNRRIEDISSPLVRLYYRFNPTHPSAADVLRWGSDYRGGCGSHVRVVVALLRAAGIQSRPLIILGPSSQNIHTVVEARIDDRWVVADALYDIVFRRADGQLASAKDLVQDRAVFHSQVDTVPGYDAKHYDYDQVTIFNWNKIPVVLPAIRRALVALMGEAKVRDITRPTIWMWPATLFAVVSFCGAAVFAGLAWVGSRSRRRWQASLPASQA